MKSQPLPPIVRDPMPMPARRQQRDPLALAVAHIERHLDASLDTRLSVGALAAAAGLSQFHFSRLFAARMGESVMAHVRRRRLLRAAARIGENPGTDLGLATPALVDLAFDCGFESQEAFTRAFKQVFGVTPGRFRRDPARHQSAAREKAMSETTMTRPDVTLLDGVARKDAFVVAGLSARIGRDNKAEIPALWPKLMRHVPLDGQKGKVGYGLCYGADMREGSFNYMAAVEIEPDRQPPAGLTLMQVPAQAYLVFRITLAPGAVQPQMQAAMQWVFSEGLPKSGRKPTGGIDLEVYGERFEPDKAGSIIDFYIPVEA